ncbi:MAG: hypothetical protein AAGA48_19030 [Myxococcota bacterium]
MSGIVRMAAVGCVLVGCSREFGVTGRPPGENVPLPEGEEGQFRTDVIVQAATPAVDVLWTIDNSGSMNCIVGCHGGSANSDFVRVTDEFDTFMERLDGSGLDYHIGVITTDMTRGGALVSWDGQRWIDENTADPVETFTDLALSVGTWGSDKEMGFGTTFLAHEDQGNETNKGFFRADASLHTIVFANEDDQTPSTVVSAEEFEGWYGGLRPQQERTFNSIVCLTGNASRTTPCLSRNVRYLEATQAIGGITWDIVSEDYGTLVEELALQAVAQGREFFLSAAPVPSTIEVWVEMPDGEKVPLSPRVPRPSGELAGDWVYVPVRNSIRLDGDYRVPALAKIMIRYATA